ncbi:MAG: tRNA lysidine(34) synthetase TilS [Gammaproteobacteria bacterium]|nr:tRNA lysidine(34) synthetase TilS [Gammaproteobacteria bacterium]
MNDSVEEFYLAHGSEPTYWLAYSGGLDSHVLLHLFAELKKTHPINLCAVHVNHGLSAYADDWVMHCKNTCEQLNVKFVHYTVNAQASVGESPEEVARESRYAVFSALLAPNDLLLTAHQQDDQAETVLLQLLRGSGPKGLSAMPAIKAFSKGFHARPLLDYTRADLTLYARENQLEWIEDESNLNTHFSRNYLRHKIIPLLKEQWPQLTKTFGRTAEHCAEAQALLNSMAEQDLEFCRGQAVNTLSVEKLLTLPAARLYQLLRLWFKASGLLTPSTAKLQQVQHVLHARHDRTPLLLWKGAEVRRYHDDLYALSSLSPHDVNEILVWDDLTSPLTIAGIGTLSTAQQHHGLRKDLANITVRFRQGGETCHLPNRGDCHHSLKKLFQTWNVPHWERDRIPLIFCGDTLISAVGYFVDDHCLAGENEAGYCIKLILNG